MKKLVVLTCCVALVFSMTGCHSLKHTVGNGPQTGVEISEAQWYALWGLVPLGRVDGGELAGGATDYEIYSRHNFVDYLISFFTSIVTITRQSVTVTK